VDEVKRFTVGQTLPALSFQLTRAENRPWGLEGTEDIKFSMRLATSAIPTIDQATAAIADPASDTVRYDWQPTDRNAEGDFRGWFTVIKAGIPEETDEFDILLYEHSPGSGVRLGAVARAARREAPIAWDFLSDLADYGDRELLEKVEFVKSIAYAGAAPTVDQEDSLDRRVIDYLGKRAAIEIIPAAIDFWSNQVIMQSARDPQAVWGFPDRIKALENKLIYLRRAADELLLVVQDIIGAAAIRPPTGPAVDTTYPLITPGLETFRHSPHGPQDPDPAVNRRRLLERSTH
jgi:hypothetical protein